MLGVSDTERKSRWWDSTALNVSFVHQNNGLKEACVVKDRAIDKVRTLLALAASANEHEAALAASHAPTFGRA